MVINDNTLFCIILQVSWNVGHVAINSELTARKRNINHFWKGNLKKILYWSTWKYIVMQIQQPTVNFLTQPCKLQPSRHTTFKQRRFSVDSMSRRWMNAKWTLFQRCVSAGYAVIWSVSVKARLISFVLFRCSFFPKASFILHSASVTFLVIAMIIRVPSKPSSAKAAARGRFIPAIDHDVIWRIWIKPKLRFSFFYVFPDFRDILYRFYFWVRLSRSLYLSSKTFRILCFNEIWYTC